MEQISERKRITLEFFNQLNEPERSQAIQNFDRNWSDITPKSIAEALSIGFEWGNTEQKYNYWNDICTSIEKNTYHAKPFDIEALAEEMYGNNMLLVNVCIQTYNKLKQLGKIKE